MNTFGLFLLLMNASEFGSSIMETGSCDVATTTVDILKQVNDVFQGTIEPSNICEWIGL